jgi:AcrR family transcriptional regulator
MEANRSVIIENAAHIIMDTGLKALTIQNLVAKLDVKENQLYNHFTKDDDILLTLLSGFETDIIEFIKELANKHVSPETELKLLFKGMYFLLLQKPYYLSLIFDKSLMKRDESVMKAFLRVKSIAENYLKTLIDTGKKENTFKTKESTKLLVGKMLSGFQLFMKDEQRFNEMILELKTLND